FYSKEDVADIIAYAAERHIEVIPEIELPGHSSAVLAAYPELGCPGTHYDVAIGEFWPTKAILCAGNDRSVDFLFGVLDEVMQMFPSDYIHIGGDEVFPDNWEHCPKCQARMRELHLEKVSQLQGWFIDTVASYLSRKGKRIVGWDEMLDCGTSAKDAVVMSWRSTEAARRAVRLGYEAVLAPTEFCYLDYYQADPKTQPLAFNGYISLVKAYSFDPMPANLTPDEQRLVLGGQANLWTEYINNYEHAEYMLLPRLCALAECFWTPVENKDWPRFMMKTEHHRTILHAYGYNCCDIPSLHDQYDAEVNH
ncbi:MAG: family 20 glycosylhydrolase, partial [Bacteroidales bacterium]|nr:family 20 glycosylhydrolase [Bacteroidales bacterium]